MYKYVAILSAAILLAGCYAYTTSPRGPVSQITLFSNYKAPITATSTTGYSKVGTSSCVSILGLFTIGDASIEAACRQSGITKIHHVDYEITQVLGLFISYKVYVYGDWESVVLPFHY